MKLNKLFALLLVLMLLLTACTTQPTEQAEPTAPATEATVAESTETEAPTEPAQLDFFDAEYNHFDMCLLGYHCADVPPEKPRCYEQMKVLASQLAQGIPEVRVDFYEVDGNIYFGELTFFSAGGIIPFDPECWDEIFGQWLQLPNK